MEPERRRYDLRQRSVISFPVDPTMAGTGTGTNQGTRNFVNTPNYPPPQQIRMSYAVGPTVGQTEVPNPMPANGRWQAGHTLGAQNGGFGNVQDPDLIFPQNGQINQGNSLNGQPTFEMWRRHEDNVNQALHGGHQGRFTVALQDQPRTQYLPDPNNPNVYHYVTPNGQNQINEDPNYFGRWG